jgi:3-hydroxyacyl-CoA dehydrogenase
MPIRRVIVIGAGTMGAGIAYTLATASMDVVLVDIKKEFVENGLRKIAGRLASDVEKGRLSPDEKEGVFSRIRGSVDNKDAFDADLVIEAIVEDRKAKGGLFRDLNGICPPDTVFATNTSTLPVTDLGALSGRPQKFVGLHFFNPAHVMRLVEVIPGINTASDTVAEVKTVVEQIKKVPIVVQDCPGFLVNRILLSLATEALRCAEEGIPPEEIDGQARKMGFPMGPLEVTDLVGMDVSLHSMPVLHEAYGERFPVSVLVRKLYEAGRLGVKSGKGIYHEGKVDDEFRRIVKDLGITALRQGSEFRIDRCILRMVNEAVACLQEGVATAEDIDQAMVLGSGFPNQQGVGGPLHWADDIGLDAVVDALNGYKATLGPRFWPHHLLKTYVSAGYKGRKTGRGFFKY